MKERALLLLTVLPFPYFHYDQDHPRRLNIIIHRARTILQSSMQEGGEEENASWAFIGIEVFPLLPRNRFATTGSRSRMVSPRFSNYRTRNSKRRGRGEGIDSGAPYQTDPLALTYRFDSSRHCPEHWSLVNSISSGRRKSGFSRDYAAAVISNFWHLSFVGYPTINQF